MNIRLWWQNLSVLKKLFSVVGVMAVLIALELFTLFFAINTLSAVRAFVGGEGIWSKAQKAAVYYLQQYVINFNEENYQAYIDNLKVSDGDHQARLALESPKLDMKAVTEGFMQGEIHPLDIPKIEVLVRRFHKVPHLARALEIWKIGDIYMEELKVLGLSIHAEIKSGPLSENRKEQLIAEILRLDQKMTPLELEFSYSLGEASRWLENTLMAILFFAVVTVESTGLYLTYRFGKYLTRVLNELNNVAIRVGEGDFSLRVASYSKDELGQLAQSLNEMVQNLENQISERELAEHASQSKNLFLANMSHEIRTPLNAILGFADILQDPHVPERNKMLYSAIIKRTGESLNTIINDILDVSKIEADKVEVHSSVFSLDQMLSDIFVVLKMRSDEKGIELIFEKKGEFSEYIVSDPNRLRQVIHNVVGNSVKFTDSGRVKLTYELCDGFLLFTITDTGAGISEKQRENLFKPFSQGDSSVRKKYGGAGLGLMIAKKLSQLMGGDVGLLESQKGIGSQFFVRISYNAAEKPSEMQSQIVDGQALLNKSILVIEDSADNQMLLEFHLQKYGAKVTFANNGKEGIDKVLAQKFDVILMDIQMPIMDGYTATQLLRKQGLQTPIIALTGFAMKEDQEKCLKAGCNDFLTKPLNKDKLIRTLVKYC